jgi:hypothetical protein
MFTKVWHTLSNAESGLESAESDFRKARHTAPKFIHGVEFLDAANMESSIRIKLVEVNQPWAHLTSEQPLVILSKNIQQPIVPQLSSLCTTWQAVPPNRSYLVLMGLAISSFLDRQDEGLVEGLDWNFRKELIDSHKPGTTVPVYHAQRLVSRKKPRSNSPIRQMMLKHQRGCFVFGLDADIPCNESINYPEGTSETSTIGIQSSDPNSTLPDLSARMSNSLKSTQESSKNDLGVVTASATQNSAAIRLKADTCESSIPMYVVNGSTNSTDLGSRSLNGSAETKRRPMMQTLKDKLFSNNQEKALPTKVPKQMELRTFANEKADPGEYDDLYDA